MLFKSYKKQGCLVKLTYLSVREKWKDENCTKFLITDTNISYLQIKDMILDGTKTPR